jgi:hypothetical protein
MALFVPRFSSGTDGRIERACGTYKREDDRRVLRRICATDLRVERPGYKQKKDAAEKYENRSLHRTPSKQLNWKI